MIHWGCIWGEITSFEVESVYFQENHQFSWLSKNNKMHFLWTTKTHTHRHFWREKGPIVDLLKSFSMLVSILFLCIQFLLFLELSLIYFLRSSCCLRITLINTIKIRMIRRNSIEWSEKGKQIPSGTFRTEHIVIR